LAEKTVVNLSCCFRLLDFVSFHEAASMPTCSWAAYIALFDKLRIQPGMTVFVHGGSGGVGHIAVQLARYHGCRVFASCSPPNVAFVESLGADNVFDYTRSDVRQLLDAATGGVGVDCILDTVGDVARFVDVLRFGGSVCCLKPAALPHPAHLSSRQASIHFLHLDGLFSSDSLTGVFRQVGEETLKLHQAGAFSVCMEVLRTDQIRQGMAQVATGHTRGKFVVDLSKPAP
ncbi:zinc-binding dehydrogenase, putative, partial [Bodo saltans]